MRQDIQQVIAERQIPYLLHFTRSENLPGIMANGLVPRSAIDCGACAGITNDNLRLDGRREYNCLSIAFPNSDMFYRFQKDNPGTEWPILVVHPQVVALKKSLFCWHNAASNEISQVQDMALESADAFRALFGEREGHPTRAEQFLKNCDPTNVQAEVLVEGVIPPEAIYYIIFPSIPCQNQYKSVIGERKSLVSDRRGYYGNRRYYRQWGYGK